MLVFKLVTQSERTDTKTEVTRWVYKDEVTTKTWEALIERLKQLFKTNSSQFVVSWFDGSDYCTIREYEELVEAIEFFTESNEKSIRLYVSPEKHEQNTIPDENPDVDQEPVHEENTSEGETEEKKEDTTLAPPSISIPEPEETPRDRPSTSEALPIATPMASVPVALAPFPMAPYLPYGMQYPYGQFYPPVQPTTVPPIIPTAQPVAQAVTSEPMPSISKPTESIPSAPPLISSAVVHSTVPATQKSEPDYEMLKALRNLSKCTVPASVPTPINPTVHRPAEQEKKARNSYIAVGLQTLRSMGYEQDAKELRKLLKLHKGNLNEVIDQLEKASI